MSSPGYKKSDSVEDRIEHFRGVVRGYVDAFNDKRVDEVLSLYASGAEVHDPVGRRMLNGKEELRAFYSAAVQHARLEITGPIRGSWLNVAATPVRAYVPGHVIDVITLTTFDDDGLISHYAAYWGPTDKHDWPGAL